MANHAAFVIFHIQSNDSGLCLWKDLGEGKRCAIEQILIFLQKKTLSVPRNSDQKKVVTT